MSEQHERSISEIEQQAGEQAAQEKRDARPHWFLVAIGYNDAAILAYLDEERPGREIPGDGSADFGEPGIVDIEMGEAGVDVVFEQLEPLPDDRGLHVWQGRIAYQRDDSWDTPEWESEYAGDWRIATADDLRRFAHLAHLGQ